MSTSATVSASRRTLPPSAARTTPGRPRTLAAAPRRRAGRRRAAGGVPARRVELDAGEQLLFGLLAEALEAAHPVLAAGRLELVDAADPELLRRGRRPSSGPGPAP